VLPPATYAALPAVATGFVDGIAVTEQLNTVWRQSSFIAAAVAQIVANGGLDALDNGDVAGFTANFLTALASQLPITTGVASFNTRTGAVVLTSADIAAALGYAPVAPTAVVSSFNNRIGSVVLTSADITAALAYIPVAPGAYTSSGLTMSTGKLLGRSTAATGAAEEITVGSGLSLSAGVLTAITGGGGTVTSASVVTANGLAGTVATPTTTPAITLSTTVTGVAKGDGTALSAAVAGIDYVAPGAYASANGLTIATGKLLGRSTAATGAAEEIAIGTGLSLSAGTLTATGGGGGTTAWAIKTANYTAVSGDRIAADTSGGAFTVTLPASPAAGNYVEFADGGSTFGTNNLTISRNSNTIMGLSEDMTLSTNNISVGLVYNGTTWRIY
jgi:hypothetical protein